ncbi:hypothetical protein B0J18DRAFT_202206 [Chaetomium sp. MPI-SDFR-AT-0129]|nr:hypothetical protein B0J18DRAFT_202206 [Chaetomium sp. MPI-SDFR-AT-0129]
MLPRSSSPWRPAAGLFAQALDSFLNSASKLQIITTVDPRAEHVGNSKHGLPEPLPPRTRTQTLLVLDSSFNPPTRAHLQIAVSAVRDLMQTRRRNLDTVRLLLLLSVNNADKAAKPAAFEKRLAMMWAFAGDVQRDLLSMGASKDGLDEGRQTNTAEADAISVDIGLATAPYFHEKSAALVEGGFYNGESAGLDEAPAETEQVFLVGYDTLIRILNPKYYTSPPPLTSAGGSGLPTRGAIPTAMQDALDPFFTRAKLRVTMRTGDEWGEVEEQNAYIHDLLNGEGLGKAGGRRDWGARFEIVEGRKVDGDIVSSTYARSASRERDWDKLDLMVTPDVRWLIEQEGLYNE